MEYVVDTLLVLSQSDIYMYLITQCAILRPYTVLSKAVHEYALKKWGGRRESINSNFKTRVPQDTLKHKYHQISGVLHFSATNSCFSCFSKRITKTWEQCRPVTCRGTFPHRTIIILPYFVYPSSN